MAVVIVLVGNMAGGKSTFASTLKKLGQEVIGMDEYAKAALYKEHLEKTKGILGQDIVNEKGELQKDLIRSRLFGEDKKYLHRINFLVRKIFIKLLSALKEGSAKPVIYVESATFLRLFKQERRIWCRYVEGVVAVCCNEEEARRRLKKRDPNLTEDQVTAIIREQIPWDKQLGLADHAFDTSSMSLENYEELVRKFLRDSH
jgi:dephospho-CoA kinase